MSKFQVLSGNQSQTFNENTIIQFEYHQNKAAVSAIDNHLKYASIEDTEYFSMFTTHLMEKTNLEVLADIDNYIRMYKDFRSNKERQSITY
jgi:hypothetical protein